MRSRGRMITTLFQRVAQAQQEDPEQALTGLVGLWTYLTEFDFDEVFGEIEAEMRQRSESVPEDVRWRLVEKFDFNPSYLGLE